MVTEVTIMDQDADKVLPSLLHLIDNLDISTVSNYLHITYPTGEAEWTCWV